MLLLLFLLLLLFFTDAMTRSIFIAQCLLYGDNKKHNVTIVVPEMTELVNWAGKQPSIAPEDVKAPYDKLLVHEGDDGCYCY